MTEVKIMTRLDWITLSGSTIGISPTLLLVSTKKGTRMSTPGAVTDTLRCIPILRTA